MTYDLDLMRLEKLLYKRNVIKEEYKQCLMNILIDIKYGRSLNNQGREDIEKSEKRLLSIAKEINLTMENCLFNFKQINNEPIK